MEIGIFSRTYPQKQLEQIFIRMKEAGIRHTQFNLLSAQMETMPISIKEDTLAEIAALCTKYNIVLDALSGTFNMVATDLEEREEGCRRFEVLCKAALFLNIPIVSLCTGSKNRQSKWKWHDANDSKETFEDLLRTTDKILKYAEAYDLVLGVEIEDSNVVHSGKIARRYFDAFNSDRLKIIMDGANLFTPGKVTDQREILEDTFSLVGKDIVLAHAKDITDKEADCFVAAGEGILDFDIYIELLRKYGYGGPLIMHGLEECQIAHSKRYLEDKLHGLY